MIGPRQIGGDEEHRPPAEGASARSGGSARLTTVRQSSDDRAVSSPHLARFALLSILWLLAVGAAARAQEAAGRQLDRVSDVGPAILACWRPPLGSAGMELTLVFSFKRNGELLGKPRISFSKLRGEPDLQKQFVASALKALAGCTPLHVAPSLGAAIAGRPFAMLFKASAPSQGI
jgi:hypothetical protein